MLNELISTITNRGLSLIGLGESGSVARNADQLIELCDLLITNQDEASGIALSCELLSSYHGMEEHEREAFLIYLDRELATDPVELELAARAYSKDQNIENLDQLSKALKSRSYQLLYRLGQSPGGIHDLVNMRADLLGFRSKSKRFESLDRDFVELFTVWFNRGFLELRQIDWNTPATILEKIIKYEAVHGIDDWDQLRARLDPADRMVYAFFHPCLEDEPLIFVEVALTGGMPNSITDILSEERQHLSPESADTATFYSISNCQVGLRGIALGNFLIKQVVEDLNKQHRNLKDFVTLSPIPSFARWAELEQSDVLANSEGGLESIENQRKELTSMVAWYLRNAKRDNGLPFDPVASFHLGNGARLERINWAADHAPKAINQSLGMMVNYRYLRDEIEKNHHQFTQGKLIAASNEVIRLERAYPAKNSGRKPLVKPRGQV